VIYKNIRAAGVIISDVKIIRRPMSLKQDLTSLYNTEACIELLESLLAKDFAVFSYDAQSF
jgi:hypothetical protein